MPSNRGRKLNEMAQRLYELNAVLKHFHDRLREFGPQYYNELPSFHKARIMKTKQDTRQMERELAKVTEWVFMSRPPDVEGRGLGLSVPELEYGRYRVVHQPPS